MIFRLEAPLRDERTKLTCVEQGLTEEEKAQKRQQQADDKRQKANDDLRMVIAPDWGMTNSAVGYVFSNKTPKDVQVLRSWPSGQGGVFEKVPTKLAYPKENPKMKRMVWGYELQPHHTQVQCWKLKHGAPKDRSTYDASSPRHGAGNGSSRLSRLPEGKSADDVTADYLTLLRKHCFQDFEDQMGKETFRQIRKTIVLTHPATWSYGPIDSLRKAAIKAGFVREGLDNVIMLSEPEAAAEAVITASIAEFGINTPFQV